MSCKQVGIVIPVLNDSTSLSRLVQEIDDLPVEGYGLHLLVVDDGSSPDVEVSLPRERNAATVRSIRTVRLACNLGHQRAIATGLVAASKMRLEAVMVMDGDGEDRPEDMAALLGAAARSPGCIVLAERARRSEPLAFRVCYRVYRLVFRLLTGHRISSGNFCLLPMHAVKALIHNPYLWNNLAATVVRSRLLFRTIPTRRGTRYAGRSHMGFVGLTVHGLSAVSVYTDVVLVRIIMGAMAAAGLVLLALAGVIGIRLLTDGAIPGWASFMAVSLVVLLLQSLMFAGVALFQLLSFRSMHTFIPAIHAREFLQARGAAPQPQQQRTVRTAGSA